jgi:COP9 signalosome complex subunit 3
VCFLVLVLVFLFFFLFFFTVSSAVNSLGCIFLLQARCAFSFDEGGLEFLQRCQNLFLQGSVLQVRMELKRFARVVHQFTKVATELQVSLRAVLPLERAIVLASTEDHQLTAIHADYLQVCLLSHSYARASRHLSNFQVLRISDPRSSGFTQSDYLRFWYYGGLVFTGMKDFGRAIEYYEACFSAPASVLSAPALESFKKHILISLIHRGQCDPRRSAPGLQMRSLRAMSAGYVELATAFGTKDAAAVLMVAQQYTEAFMRDNNWGLVSQCIESLAGRNIRGLTQTYITMSLDVLAKDAKMAGGRDEARKKLLRMVEQGSIVAQINEKDGMVAFGESENKFRKFFVNFVLFLLTNFG